MAGSHFRRWLRASAALGVAAGLAAAGFMPSGAQAQGYYRGGYGLRYGPPPGYYPGPYYAPHAYVAAPPVLYVQPPVRYAPPVRRIVHRTPVRAAAMSAAPGSCAAPHTAMPVALTRLPAPAPALSSPVPPPATAPQPGPAAQTPPLDLYEPRPSAGD